MISTRAFCLAILCSTPAFADDRMLVHISCSGGSEGTGVAISADGHVLTAHHVVPKDATCTAALGDKSAARADIQLLYPISGLDGAVMLLNQPTPHFATYCPMDTHLKEARVIAKGFHAGSKTDPHVTEGIISSSDISAGAIDTDVVMNPGQSGGPVFLKHSTALVGIVAGAKFNSVGLVETYQAVPAELLAPAARLQLATNCAPQVKIFTLAEHEKRLNQKIADTRANYERLITEVKSASEAQRGELRAQLSFSNLQLQQLLEDKANLDASYAARVEELRLLRLELEKLKGGSVSEARLAAAQEALFEGDTERARQAFEDIRAAETQAVFRLATAEYGLGKIADDEVRWHDAYQHFATAARLVPNYVFLLAATDFANSVGFYDVANQNSAELISSAISEFGSGSRQHSVALDRQGRTLQNLGQFADAEPFFWDAANITANNLGTEHPSFAARLNNLAGLLEATGRYDDAERYYRHALAVKAETLGTQDTQFAAGLNNLGLLLEATGRYETAEGMFRRAIAVGAESLGTNHPEYATFLNNLAIVLDVTGQSAEAEQLFREALSISARTIGTMHPNYAKNLSNLAGLLEETGRVDEAERAYREALEIAGKTLGDEHPDFAGTLNNLAYLLETTGRHQEAEPLYREALDIGAKTLGTDHPDYAKLLSNLAGPLEASGRLDEAEPIYREAMDIAERSIGTEHPHYAKHMGNLAGLLKLKGEYAEAETLYRQALVILERTFGDAHPNTVEGRNNLQAVVDAATGAN